MSGVVVVLSGGGGRGLAHLGVLEVLDDAGIPIDRIVGVSSGSLAGALYGLYGAREAQRRVLELGYFAGLSCSEMAESLGVPIGTVKSRLHAALKRTLTGTAWVAPTGRTSPSCKARSSLA